MTLLVSAVLILSGLAAIYYRRPWAMLQIRVHSWGLRGATPEPWFVTLHETTPVVLGFVLFAGGVFQFTFEIVGLVRSR